MSALPIQPADEPKALPHSFEAEQALLGMVLYDNNAYERVPDNFRAEHFYEPIHGLMWRAIEGMIRKGQHVEPLGIRDRFANDPAFNELGGLSYLALLVDQAPITHNPADYARTIRDFAVRRDLIRIFGEGTQAAETDVETAPREQIEKVEGELYALAETGGRAGGVVTFAEALTGAVEMAAAAIERGGGLSGLSTGLIDLDRKLGGLHPSDLLILAGRPSMGKTALATNIAFNVARRYRYEMQADGTAKTVEGGRVLFFSLEMSAEQLGLRVLADVANVSGDKIRKGEIDAADFARIREASLEIESAPLSIDDTGGLRIDKLTARARREKRRNGLDLIVVDYLQLITTGGKGQGRVQEVSEITMGLKSLAKELDVPIIALSQLSRQVEQREDKRPQLSDLRESGSIEQDADAVMFVYREAYYLGRSEPRDGTPEHLTWEEEMDRCRGMAEVIIGKQRHGPIGTLKLSFDENTTRFGNLAHDRWGQSQGYGDD